MATKLGMTQMFKEDGTQVPVTVLKVEPNVVVALKNRDEHGYVAVQLGTNETHDRKIKKPQSGYYKKLGSKNYRRLKEFRVDSTENYVVGDVIGVTHFQPGQYIDITGITKGKGFAGGMKRHGFGGLRASHGVSITHRCHGSTGNRTQPGKVFKGKKMAGHMGDVQVTIQNLKIHLVDAEKGVILVHGAVPGCKSGTVYVKDAIKKAAPGASR
jgi:large subunit ribosomal protein L3